MNNYPGTTAAGTAASIIFILTYVIGLGNVHWVVEVLHWDPVPADVIGAVCGLIVGWIINKTHGAPAPAPGTAEVTRSSTPVAIPDPPPAAAAATAELAPKPMEMANP